MALDPVKEEDLGEKLRELTNWKGLDVVIEYSGAMQAALKGIAFGGNVVGPVRKYSDNLAEEYEQAMAHPEWGAKMGLEY